MKAGGFACFVYHQTLDNWTVLGTLESSIICDERIGNRKICHMWLEQSEPCRQMEEMWLLSRQDQSSHDLVGDRKGFR